MYSALIMNEDDMHIINTISGDEIDLIQSKRRMDNFITDMYRKHCGLKREFRIDIDTMRMYYELIPV